eukprot:2749379-Amphidinium_carterae.1
MMQEEGNSQRYESQLASVMPPHANMMCWWHNWATSIDFWSPMAGEMRANANLSHVGCTPQASSSSEEKSLLKTS